jgi:hypothetical protein
VEVGPHLLTLKPSKSNLENPGEHRFTISIGDDGFDYKGVPAIPTFQTYPISQDELIEGLLKVAGERSFDS